MPTTLEGELTSGNARIAIVVSRFNEFITERLLDSAIHCYERHGGDTDKLTVAWVPGSFELALIAKRLAESGKYDAIVTLGCVIRGATSHYDHVAGQAASGIAKAGMDTGVPVIFGVITAESIEQSIERAGSKQGNTGEKAMLAAIEMVNLVKKIDKKS
jgi:6,7-dimethyl-8-ribityllumazine synthase